MLLYLFVQPFAASCGEPVTSLLLFINSDMRRFYVTCK